MFLKKKKNVDANEVRQTRVLPKTPAPSSEATAFSAAAVAAAAVAAVKFAGVVVMSQMLSARQGRTSTCHTFTRDCVYHRVPGTHN